MLGLRIMLFVVCAAALVLLPASCHLRPKRVVIGIALTSSNHSAVRLAAKEINDQSGIDGVPVELMGLDWQFVDRFEAADILRWAQRFAENRDLVAIIGHSDSSSTLSAAAFYNQHEIPQIVTIATNPAITSIGRWTYRLCLSDAVQGPALAEYVVKEWGKKTVAVFYVNDAYGRVLAELFQKRVKELGGSIVASVLHRNVIETGDLELIGSTLDELKRTGEPDLFVLFQRQSAAQWTLGAIHQRGFRSAILGGDNLSPPQFSRATADVSEGMRVSQFFWPHPENQRSQEFVRKFTAAEGGPPDYGQAFAYDALYLLRDAIQNGGFNRDGVRSYLDRLIRNQTVVSGVAGSYVIGQDHDARRSLLITEVHNGVQRLIKEFPVK